MITPITRREIFLSNAAGNGDDLPEPITREEQYLKEICKRIDSGGVSPEDIQSAVNDYLDEHGIDFEIATMAEFLEVLNNGTD